MHLTLVHTHTYTHRGRIICPPPTIHWFSRHPTRLVLKERERVQEIPSQFLLSSPMKLARNVHPQAALPPRLSLRHLPHLSPVTAVRDTGPKKPLHPNSPTCSSHRVAPPTPEALERLGKHILRDLQDCLCQRLEVWQSAQQLLVDWQMVNQLNTCCMLLLSR